MKRLLQCKISLRSGRSKLATETAYHLRLFTKIHILVNKLAKSKTYLSFLFSISLWFSCLSLSLALSLTHTHIHKSFGGYSIEKVNYIDYFSLRYGIMFGL